MCGSHTMWGHMGEHRGVNCESEEMAKPAKTYHRPRIKTSLEILMMQLGGNGWSVDCVGAGELGHKKHD